MFPVNPPTTTTFKIQRDVIAYSVFPSKKNNDVFKILRKKSF